MQLYALDSDDQPIIAKLAKKGRNYFCPECRSPLRVRGGSHRQPHFFHLTHNRSCRQSGKSQTHLQVQNVLFDLLPAREVILECRFAAINRIADVVWLPKRLVFEVQCSPITADEVFRRNQDYHREGFQTVWILHDLRFKRWRATAAENLLQNSPAYFTNIDSEGKGIIYDQYAPIFKGIRRVQSKPFLVNLSKPLPIPDKQTPNAYLNHRLESWPLYFQGDIVDTYHQKPLTCPFLEKESVLAKRAPKVNIINRFFIRPYLNVFQYLLEHLSL